MACASFFPEEEEERPFVDREEFIQASYNALETIKGKEANILVYHSVAGIGKTRLRREISKIIEKYNDLNRNFRIYNESNSNFHILCATVDFETEEYRQSDKFLEILRDQFQGEYDIKFHTFDFAHALYWKKVNPRIPLCKENDSEDNIFTHLLDIGDDLSTIGGIFNPVNVSIKMAKLIKRLPASYREWELKNRNEISRLISMEAAEIRRQLHLYWAYDLREYLQRNSESAVIFIDSYEALWGNDRSLASLSSKDEWLRKEIQTLLSSSCLWILCGQESPRWTEDSNTEKAIWGNSIERHEIKGLPEEHSRNLLKNDDVLENDIQTAIISGSEGVPYYLDLSIDLYRIIKKSREPEPGDFAKVPPDIFKRFIKYLDEPKETAIKVLSVPRFWNREIFNVLIKEFTSYPKNEMSRIHNFSFINKDEIEDNKWSMHQLMRKSWQEYQENEKNEEQDYRKSVHEFMLSYYVNKLENLDIKKITREHTVSLIEAFYHAKESLEAEDLLNWFITVSDPFGRAAFWQLISPLYEEMLKVLEQKLGPEHLDVATTLNNLALLYYKMGDYEKALPLYQRALDIREKVLGPQHPDVATTLNNLAGFYDNMGDYEQALPLYQRALDISEKALGPQHPDVANSLNNLAALYDNMGDYEKALPLYRRALGISEKVLGPQHPKTIRIRNNFMQSANNRENKKEN
jgi:tetratricopeptide (TPR) repeat protein